MEYVFFNTVDGDILNKYPTAKCIWLHNNNDAVKSIQYIVCNSNPPVKSVYVEDVFLSFLSEDKSREYNWMIFSLSGEKDDRKTNHIAFFASNDTIASSFVPILDKLSVNKVTNYIPFTKDEKAGSIFSKYEYTYEVFSVLKFLKHRPELLILANDWGEEERFVILVARLFKIKTICLQESIIDFGEKPTDRMRWCDFVFVQGARTILELDRNLYFVTGNPRYDEIVFQEKPHAPKAFINCNFTYNIFEDQRDRWLSGIIQTLDKYNVAYVISQHPRDTGDLSKYHNVEKSNSTLVHEQIKCCSFVITRFSSLIHEAICMGRQVVYYNPHKENMKYDFQFDNTLLYKSEDQEDLERVVREVISGSGALSYDKNNEYLLMHCKNINKLSSLTVKDLIENNVFYTFYKHDFNRKYCWSTMSYLKVLLKSYAKKYI